MAFSPISQGDGSIIHNTFTTDTGTYPLTGGITSADLKMYYEDLSTHITRKGTGTWTITNAGAGMADYAPSPEDVGTAGLYRVYPVIQLATGPKAFDAQMLDIKETLYAPL